MVTECKFCQTVFGVTDDKTGKSLVKKFEEAHKHKKKKKGGDK